MVTSPIYTNLALVIIDGVSVDIVSLIVDKGLEPVFPGAVNGNLLHCLLTVKS